MFPFDYRQGHDLSQAQTLAQVRGRESQVQGQARVHGASSSQPVPYVDVAVEGLEALPPRPAALLERLDPRPVAVPPGRGREGQGGPRGSGWGPSRGRAGGGPRLLGARFTPRAGGHRRSLATGAPSSLETPATAVPGRAEECLCGGGGDVRSALVPLVPLTRRARGRVLQGGRGVAYPSWAAEGRGSLRQRIWRAARVSYPFRKRSEGAV